MDVSQTDEKSSIGVFCPGIGWWHFSRLPDLIPFFLADFSAIVLALRKLSTSIPVTAVLTHSFFVCSSLSTCGDAFILNVFNTTSLSSEVYSLNLDTLPRRFILQGKGLFSHNNVVLCTNNLFSSKQHTSRWHDFAYMKSGKVCRSAFASPRRNEKKKKLRLWLREQISAPVQWLARLFKILKISQENFPRSSLAIPFTKFLSSYGYQHLILGNHAWNDNNY